VTRRPRAGSGGARGGSPFWGVVFRVFYRILRLLDPFIRQWWRGYGLGNACELRVAGRATGRQRTFLLGLLRADGAWYLGHPNGDTAWTRNLEAAPEAQLVLRWPNAFPIVAHRLLPGEERTRAILATRQHIFPGTVLYRLARRHILAVGVYFRIELADPGTGVSDSGSRGSDASDSVTGA
jgi:hypothetical protein